MANVLPSPERRGRRPDPNAAAAAAASTGLAAAVGGVAVLAAGFAELLLGMPLPRWLYLAAAAALLLPLAMACALRRRGPTRPVTGCTVAVLAALAILHLVPWNSRKPFLARLGQIRPGMSAAVAERLMDGYRRGTGWRDGAGELVLSGAMVFRHSDDPAFNSDWGVVHLDARGYVRRVEFLGD